MLRRDCLGLAGALALAAPAKAQQLLKVPPGNNLKIVLPKITGESTIRTSGARSSVTTAADVPIAPAAALARFHLGFNNGDHKFRRLQLLVEGNNARAALNDQNDDDPFEVHARWINFSGGAAAVASGSGHGRAVTQMTIPPGPPRHVFALRGFEFRRKEGTDANIRHLAIRQNGNAIEALLSDDEGMDLRGGGGINPLDPLTSFLAQQMRSSKQRGRPYDVIVQYIWIPELLVASTGMITGSERSRRDAASVPAGRAAIRGFSFSFLNSDHHLLQVHASTLDGGLGIFRDNNEDDPVRWSVDYALLRG
jgi:hypothetical protein